MRVPRIVPILVACQSRCQVAELRGTCDGNGSVAPAGKDGCKRVNLQCSPRRGVAVPA